MSGCRWCRLTSVPLVAVLVAGGCNIQSVKPISGGTTGVLMSDSNPIPDVLVRIHRSGSGEPIGFGITRTDGSFELVTDDSRGPLNLPPGKYVITLESVGAPTDLPDSLRHVKSSRLQIDWSGEDILRVNVPGLTLKQY